MTVLHVDFFTHLSEYLNGGHVFILMKADNRAFNVVKKILPARTVIVKKSVQPFPDLPVVKPVATPTGLTEQQYSLD